MNTRSKAKTSVYICLRVDTDGLGVREVRKMAGDLQEALRHPAVEPQHIGNLVGNGIWALQKFNLPKRDGLAAASVQVLSVDERALEVEWLDDMRRFDTSEERTPQDTDAFRMDVRLVVPAPKEGAWVTQERFIAK